MFRFKKTMAVAAMVAATSLTAVPAHADDDKPAKADVACTAAELDAHLAAVKKAAAEQARREAAKKAGKHTSAKKVRAEGTPVPAATTKAEKAAKAKKQAAEEKAYALKKAAKNCAHYKKKARDKAARARKFQAIGVVAVSDAAAGTVTVAIKAGSPDLHRRKLVIKVTAASVVKLDGEAATVADLISGTFVSVHGVRDSGALVAGKINAASPGVEDEPAPTPAAVPTPAAA